MTYFLAAILWLPLFAGNIDGIFFETEKQSGNQNEGIEMSHLAVVALVKR